MRCSLLALAPDEMTCRTKQNAVISGEGSYFIAYSLSSLSSGASKYSKYFSLRSSANRPRALSTGGGETQWGGGECYGQGTLSKAKQTYIHVQSLQYPLPTVPIQRRQYNHTWVYVPALLIPFLAVQ